MLSQPCPKEKGQKDKQQQQKPEKTKRTTTEASLVHLPFCGRQLAVPICKNLCPASPRGPTAPPSLEGSCRHFFDLYLAVGEVRHIFF